jgi:hypothetical protein
LRNGTATRRPRKNGNGNNSEKGTGTGNGDAKKKLSWRKGKNDQQDAPAAALAASRLGPVYFIYAILAAGYVTNYTPCRVNSDWRTPNHMWYGRELPDDHLRAFGRPCYILDDSKIPQPSALKGIFLGYATALRSGSYDRKSYHVRIPTKNSTRISAHVAVDETDVCPDSATAIASMHDIMRKFAPCPADKAAKNVAPSNAAAPPLVANRPRRVTKPVVVDARPPVSAAESVYNEDRIIVLGSKTPKSEYIKARVTLAVGKTMAAALTSTYANNTGQQVPYRLADLKYDLNQKYLASVVVSEGDASARSAVFSLAATLDDAKTPLSAEELIHIKSYRELYGDSEIHIEVEREGSTETFLIRKVTDHVRHDEHPGAAALHDTSTTPAAFPAKPMHNDDNPTYGQAMRSQFKEKWLDAILAEYAGLADNGTWELVQLPHGERPLNVKLVLKRKRGSDGEILKYKARLVVLGNEMKQLDYLSELFAPVAQMGTFKIMLALATQFRLELKQFDFSQAFLQAVMHGKPVYVKQGPGQPPILDDNGQPQAYKLIKSLYGLPFAPRLWHQRIHDWLLNYGFTVCRSDPSLYSYKGVRLLLYVDDALCMFDNKKDKADYDKFMVDLAKDFKYTGNEDVEFFLGFGVTRDRDKDTTTIDQRAFINKLVQQNGQANAAPVDTPVVTGQQLGHAACGSKGAVNLTHYRQRVGGLLWCQRGSKPELAFGVNALSRAMHDPGKVHWDASSRMLAYLNSTNHLGITYRRCTNGGILHGCVDADFLPRYGCEFDNMKSTTGWVFMLAGAAVSWRTRRQSVFATSTAHAECNAGYDAACEVKFLRKIMHDMGYPQHSATLLHEDNQSLIKISMNATDQERTKHWDSKIFALRDWVLGMSIKFAYVSTKNQMADFFTKALPAAAFKRARDHCNGSKPVKYPIQLALFGSAMPEQTSA